MLLDGLALAWRELTLFAAVGFLVIGLDDLLVDLVWLMTRRPDDRFPKPKSRRNQDMALAVFIPAWDENAVIGPMIERCRTQWAGQSYRLFVGVYPNDPETCAEVTRHAGPDLCMVIAPRPGPTTKADCLNALWVALCEERSQHGGEWAVVLHDAEDLAHPRELIVYRHYLADQDMVQLPVMPLVDPASCWIGGHYIDEFSEAHGKELPTRTAIGASLPSAGVGCAIRAHALDHLASSRNGKPFDEMSLTEDYEIGLKLADAGFRSRFVRVTDPETHRVVAVHACFPNSLPTAVRQKARWVTGIALAGWDRIGWTNRLAESWMRWRDRRSILSAIILTSGYLSMLLAIPLMLTGQFDWTSGPAAILFLSNALLLIWRLGFRAALTGEHYGARQGVLAVPRAFVTSIIAIMSARRAVMAYFTMLRSGRVVWDKTRHRFPVDGTQ